MICQKLELKEIRIVKLNLDGLSLLDFIQILFYVEKPHLMSLHIFSLQNIMEDLLQLACRMAKVNFHDLLMK